MTDGLICANLLFEPDIAGVDLSHVGLFMKPPLPTRLPFEVFDGIGDEQLRAVETGTGESPVQHGAGGTHERLTAQVFFVSRLLADQHDAGIARPRARHRLGRVPPNVAAAAGLWSIRLAVGRRQLADGFRGVNLGFLAHWDGALILTSPSFSNRPISAASGRFFQYFCGISRCMATGLIRATLQMLR